jgi:hypothetical protein
VKKATKTKKTRIAILPSEQALDLINSCTAKINAFVAVEIAKLQKRIRKQVKDELKGNK